MNFIPFKYGRSAGGMEILPSSAWRFSISAISARPTATPEPFKVCANSLRRRFPRPSFSPLDWLARRKRYPAVAEYLHGRGGRCLKPREDLAFCEWE